MRETGDGYTIADAGRRERAVPPPPPEEAETASAVAGIEARTPRVRVLFLYTIRRMPGLTYIHFGECQIQGQAMLVAGIDAAIFPARPAFPS